MANTQDAAVLTTAASGNQIIRKPIITNDTTFTLKSKGGTENNLSARTNDSIPYIDFSIISTFPETFKQRGTFLPKELLNQPRWFKVGSDKISHTSWNLLENQQPFNKIKGNKGFDISGHDTYPEYLVLDWDHVYNPKTGEWLNEFAHHTFNWIVYNAPDVYVESSISRTGFHMILHPTDDTLCKITNAGRNVLQFGNGAKLEVFYKNKAKCVVFTGYKISESTEIISGDSVNHLVQQLLKEIHKFNHVQPLTAYDETPAFTTEQNQIRAQEMLKYIPVTNLNRADWRTVIRCWKDLNLPYDMIEEWSATDSRHNDGNDVTFKETWDNMEPGDPVIAIKTLCSWAEQYGGYNSIHHMDQKLWHQFNIDNKLIQLSGILHAIKTQPEVAVKKMSINYIKSFVESESNKITNDLMYAVGFCSQFADPAINLLIAQVKMKCKTLGVAVPDFNNQVKNCLDQIQSIQTEMKHNQRNISAQDELDEILHSKKFEVPIDLHKVVWPDNLIPNWKSHTLDKITPQGTVTAFKSIMLVTETLTEIQTGIQNITVACLKQGCKDWKYITASRDIFVSNNKILTLSKQGLLVRSKSAGEVVEFIGQFEELNTKIIPNKILVYQPGWYGDEFIFPNRISNKYTLDLTTAYKI